jgi:hypothetical protein
VPQRRASNLGTRRLTLYSLLINVRQVKILMQVSSVNTQSAAAKAAAQGGLVSAFMTIGKTEGVLGYWRGNVPQVGDTCDSMQWLLASETDSNSTTLCRCCVCCRIAPASITGAPTRRHEVMKHGLLCRCSLVLTSISTMQLREAEEVVCGQGWQTQCSRPPRCRGGCCRHQHTGA